MIVETLRPLDLSSALTPGLPPHVAAASGLARVEEWLHVVPDDALQLVTFALGGKEPGRTHPLFPDPALPQDEKERKKLKPDLESLTVVPWKGGEALLAVGSGSSDRRRRGILQPLFDCGEVSGSALLFDLGPLYDALPFKELNVEGLACVGLRLFLGQRGNSAEGRNELVELDLLGALSAIESGKPWGPALVKGMTPLGLGEVLGVRLTLTDLSACGPDHLLVAAAAEDTANPYDDGAVIGSALGRYSLRDGTMTMVSLDGPWKVEGVEMLEDGRVLMVTDGDDPHQPALLLEARDLVF